MGKKEILKNHEIASYYDEHRILDELEDEEVDISLEEGLKEDILSGKRKRRLKNISLKIDPFQIQAVKKLAKMKSIPYQTLIRHWLSENIKQELNL